MGIREKHGVEVKDTVPLDGTREACDEAFYVASELTAAKIEPKAERTLFQRRKKKPRFQIKRGRNGEKSRK